jgi:hypothetical protein
MAITVEQFTRDAAFVKSVTKREEHYGPPTADRATSLLDVIELRDGRCLVLNGEAVVLFPNRAAVLDEAVDASNFPTIELMEGT